MNERLKKIREELSIQKGKKISRQYIADDLGVSVSNIESYELARRSPSSAFIRLFCDRYGVNEEWLLTGKGAMFKPLDKEQEIAILTKKLLKAEPDDELAKLIKNLANLDIEDWKALNRIIKKLLKEEKDSSN